MSYYYCKAEGFDFLGHPCVVYFRTKRPIHNVKNLARRLYCEETGHAITRIYAPRIKYFLSFVWYTLKGKNTTPEDWTADPVNTITI